MSFSTTFKVSEKKLEKYEERYNQKPEDLDGKALKLIANTRPFREHHCTEVLQGSNFPHKTRIVSNGFVDTVVHCYNHHHNLVLRPDDVWTAIMVQFSFYVNKEAEKFRNRFVNFEGKRELEVSVVGSLRAAPFDLLVKLMSKEIDKNLVDPEVKAWILPGFSTSTDDDLVTCGVVLMATMKKYFDYKMCLLLCGIPNVTLEGTVQDWENIGGRLEKLKEYELEWWYDMLKPILDQFVSAKKGKADVKFWDRVCNRHGGGSGPTFLSGWITAFCVFDKDGNKQGEYGEMKFSGKVKDGGAWPWIDMDDIPPGSVEVDVKIEDSDETEYHSVMFAGHLGREILQDACTLKPTTGWAICLKPSPEEIKEIEDAEKAKDRFRM